MEIGECGKSGKTLIGVFKEIKYDLRVCGHNKHFIKTRPLIGLWGLNPIYPGLFWYIRYRGGGHIVVVSWGWVGLGFQFFLEMTCLGVIYHVQKDS